MSLESPSLPHGPHPSGGPVAGHADDASKAILDRAGFMPQKPGEGRDGDKCDLSDLSIAELEAFIRQGQERQRQAGAVDTEGTILGS